MSCISRAIGTALIAAAVSILPAFAGDDARAAEENLDTLFVRILINPTDVDLNLRYAKLAEEQGEIRKALATYERILLQDPDNSEAKAGYYPAGTGAGLHGLVVHAWRPLRDKSQATAEIPVAS